MAYPVAAVRGSVVTPAAAAGAWSPASLASLTAWWDFSDATTLYTDAGVTPVSADGQALYQAGDKSGGGHHFVQSSAGNRPVYKTAIQNSRSIARFDGTTRYMETADHADLELNTDSTVVAVLKLNTTAATIRGILSKDNNGTAGAYYLYAPASSSVLHLDRPWIASGPNSIGTLGTSAFKLGVCHVSGTTITLYIDGGASAGSGSLTTGSATNLALRLGVHLDAGYRNYWDGDMGEVVVCNTALSVTDLNLLGSYLATKWALSWTPIA